MISLRNHFIVLHTRSRAAVESRGPAPTERRGLTAKTNKSCVRREMASSLRGTEKNYWSCCTPFPEQKKASTMLKPNTKSLLPDRFGERIISAARIISSTYIIEAYEGVEHEMELGQKPIYDFCGALQKQESGSRCCSDSSLQTQVALKLGRLPSVRQVI